MPLTAQETLARLRPHLPVLLPGLGAVLLWLDWAIQDGGYDPSTWYWGALLLVSATAVVMLRGADRRARLGGASRIALGALALYVAWSYLSITWAQSPGDALEGSNRALMYLALFTVLAMLPWTAETALAALLAFVTGAGLLAFLFLARLSSHVNVAAIVVNGRLEAPTGYFNATVALFTMTALVATAFAARRTLPVPVRGLLIGVATAGLELATTGESRGWLFTLPLVLVATIAVVPDRARFLVAAAIPAAGTVAIVHRLLGLYDSRGASRSVIDHAASRAGGAALVTCVVAIALGTVLAAADTLLRAPAWLRRRRRLLSGGIAVLALAAVLAGGLAATHGDPIHYIKREWNGFSQPEQHATTGSRFDVVGSGRYDFWRVALKAFTAHPIGGLGQDNFADYYVTRRKTTEEPAWTHSLEMRLLAHTGLVGALLFLTFVVAAVLAAVRRRAAASELGRWVIAAASLPFAVWLIHGSVDWFWEVPALTGPALGFLAVAGSIGAPPAERARRRSASALATLGWLAACAVLAFPYLAVVEQSRASHETGNPVSALRDLATAAELNPLSAVPGRIAGDLALETQQYEVALHRFRQSIVREPGGWFGWLGAGLAASELHEVARARRDFRVAATINPQQPAVTAALARVGTSHPLSAAEALQRLVVVR